MIAFRWLGVAGLEFVVDGYTLLVDPFFTRPPRRALLTAARVHSNEALCAQHAPRADAVLVTHAHYDHIMDVPSIAWRTGAGVYGSPNACALLAAHGIADGRVRTIHQGDRLALGPFSVEVFPARHAPIPAARLFNGPLPRRLRPPLRLCDYRMDHAFSFRIRAGEETLLIGNHPAPAGTLFLIPYQPQGALRELLAGVSPRRIILIHWDDFNRPLNQPLAPMLLTRAQGLPRGFPPLRRIDLASTVEQVRAAAPGVPVEVPGLFVPGVL